MNLKVWKLTAEQQHNKTQQAPIIETQVFYDGFHPSWATSPWSNFIVWAFVLASIVKKICLQSSVASSTCSNGSKTSKYTKNDSSWAKIGWNFPPLWKKKIPTFSPLNLENVQISPLNLELRPKIALLPNKLLS